MSQLLYRSLEPETIKQTLEALEIKNVFTQNSKMKRSSKSGIQLYNFGIPAFKSITGLKTCPKAGVCATGCYAQMSTYTWPAVAKAYENRLKLTQHRHFKEVIVAQIDKLLKKYKNELLLLRIHDAGDFYSKEYQLAWYSIAKAFINEPRVNFYSYTKMVAHSKELKEYQPNNFELIYSYGGLEDKLIDVEQDRHSKVFSSIDELTKAGYANANESDLVALGSNPKIGLVYHGVKGYAKTKWSKIK